VRLRAVSQVQHREDVATPQRGVCAWTSSSDLNPSTEGQGATQLAGPKENGSASSKEAAKPAAGAAKAQPAAAPARSTDSSSRFTFSTPASEDKLWFYRDTKVGPQVCSDQRLSTATLDMHATAEVGSTEARPQPVAGPPLMCAHVPAAYVDIPTAVCVAHG
jgi:hypothetical protein